MKRLFLTLCVGVACLAGVPTARAQVTFEGCRDLYGMPVPSINAPGINDIAIATVQGGRPVILYNPRVLVRLPPIVRRFFYAHECAHHQLAHLLRGTPNVGTEQEADCWAAHALRSQGATAADFAVISQAIAALGAGDWTHLPGPARAINVQRCLAVPMPRPPPLGTMCCDVMGQPRCRLSAPLPAGGSCMCPGLGYGRVCPPMR